MDSEIEADEASPAQQRLQYQGRLRGDSNATTRSLPPYAATETPPPSCPPPQYPEHNGSSFQSRTRGFFVKLIEEPTLRVSSDSSQPTGPEDPPAGLPDEIDASTHKDGEKEDSAITVCYRDSVIAQREFIVLLATAVLSFGAPSHRFDSQLNSVIDVFSIPTQFFTYVSGSITIYFLGTVTHLGETLKITSEGSLDLGRIKETHKIYQSVVRNEISASEGTQSLKKLRSLPPLYGEKLQYLLAFFQGFILCSTAFGGSIIDMSVAAILNIGVTFMQQISSQSNIAVIGANVMIAGLVSFIARLLSALIPNQIFCYQAISSTSVAGLLAGSYMLFGVLELVNDNVNSGFSKMMAAVTTSLCLGFGLTLGSDLWLRFDPRGRLQLAKTASKLEVSNGTYFSTNDAVPLEYVPMKMSGQWTYLEYNTVSNVVKNCYRNKDWSWWLQPLPFWSLVILLPVLNLVLSIRKAQPIWSREMVVMIVISCASTLVTDISISKLELGGRPTCTALFGSFIVSLLGNLYSRVFGGTAYTVMLTGISLLIPGGLAAAGGLSSAYAPGEDEYTQSLKLAAKMVFVIIGVVCGVYVSVRAVYHWGKKKKHAYWTF